MPWQPLGVAREDVALLELHSCRFIIYRLLVELQLREVLARSIHLHRPRDLHQARILLDSYDERVHTWATRESRPT
jgi:hypothetical protein